MVSAQPPHTSLHVLWRSMQYGAIPTELLWYSQTSCGSTFTCGKLLLSTIHELQDGRTNHLRHPKFLLDVVYICRLRRWVSLDNRRLYALWRAGCILARCRLVGRCVHWGRRKKVWDVTSPRISHKILDRDAIHGLQMIRLEQSEAPDADMNTTINVSDDDDEVVSIVPGLHSMLLPSSISDANVMTFVYQAYRKSIQKHATCNIQKHAWGASQGGQGEAQLLGLPPFRGDQGEACIYIYIYIYIIYIYTMTVHHEWHDVLALCRHHQRSCMEVHWSWSAWQLQCDTAFGALAQHGLRVVGHLEAR